MTALGHKPTSIFVGARLVCGFGGKHVVSRQSTPDTLERKLLDRLDGHGTLDRHQHARTDQDLPWFGFVAKPRYNIGHRPDSGIIEPSLKAHGAEATASLARSLFSVFLKNGRLVWPA